MKPASTSHSIPGSFPITVVEAGHNSSRQTLYGSEASLRRPYMDSLDLSLAERQHQLLANAAYLYPNHAGQLSVITRLHHNTNSPFDEDALHAVSWSAILVVTSGSSRIVLVEAATPTCPLTGKLRVDYHAGCKLGSRNGAFNALLIKTEMMVDAKLKQDEIGPVLRRQSTVGPYLSQKSSPVVSPSESSGTLSQVSRSTTLKNDGEARHSWKGSSSVPDRRLSVAHFDSRQRRITDVNIDRRAFSVALGDGPKKSAWIDDGGETGVGSRGPMDRGDSGQDV